MVIRWAMFLYFFRFEKNKNKSLFLFLVGEQWEYTNWAPDTPQGDGMGVNIDWINGDTPYGYFNFQWEWNDAPLDHFHPYVCESTL